MQSPTSPPPLTPLQRAIYEIDQLGLPLRESMRLATQQLGFFVGQHRYLKERENLVRYLEQYGAEALAHAADPRDNPREATHQIGSP